MATCTCKIKTSHPTPCLGKVCLCGTFCNQKHNILTIAGLLPNVSNLSKKNAGKDLSSTKSISTPTLFLIILGYLVD